MTVLSLFKSLNHPKVNTYRLAAVSFAHRQIALAIFKDIHLEYARTRQLGASQTQAEKSVTGFLNWAFEHFGVHALALLSPPAGTRGSALDLLAANTAQKSGLPVWRVTTPELFAAFAHPPLKTVQQLREVAWKFWPVLNERSAGRLARDAAAAGLYVQVERMFAAAKEAQTP